MKEDALHDLRVAAAVAVAVVVAVTVTVAVAVTAAAAAVLEDEDAHQVDDEAQDGDDEEPLVLHLGRLHQSLHRLGEDEEGDEEKKQAVDEAGQDLGPHVAVTVLLVGRQFGDDGGHEAGQ